MYFEAWLMKIFSSRTLFIRLLLKLMNLGLSRPLLRFCECKLAVLCSRWILNSTNRFSLFFNWMRWSCFWDDLSHQIKNFLSFFLLVDQKVDQIINFWNFSSSLKHFFRGKIWRMWKASCWLANWPVWTFSNSKESVQEVWLRRDFHGQSWRSRFWG